MNKHISLFIMCLFALISCESANKKQEKTTNVEELSPSKYTLTPFQPSKEFSDAAISELTYQDGQMSISVAGESYKLGEQTSDVSTKMCANSAKGQHVHVIVNDNPYSAKYESNFSYEIPDGTHYLLSFLSRSYHESIKTEAAHVAIKGVFKNNTLTNQEDIDNPMLFYSRPKGTYIGDDTKKLMLDFYLVNAEIGENMKVNVDINGENHTVEKWQPYYITGLEMGDNTITLTLIDENGQAVASPLNPVSRTFTLKENAEDKM